MDLGIENEKVEYKKSMRELDKGVISLASMLNKNCEATLYIGVNNDGSIKGIDTVTESTLRDVSRRISEGIKPQVIPHITLEKIEQKNIIKVYVRGNDTPYSAFDIFYVRSADEDKKMDINTLKKYLFKDNLPDAIAYTEASNQNLTFELLKNYYINHGIKINEKYFEENLGLLTQNGKYNIMAELLADKNNVSIIVATFAGTDKSILVKREDFGHCCLVKAARDVLTYVESINEINVKVGSFTRQEKPNFDFECFKEAWLNAVVHNRWIDGATPAVYIYDNKIEIVSAGGLPPNLTEDEYFSGVSRPVNQKLLNVFYDLEIIEKTGHGVPLIVDKYGKEIFKITKNTIRIFIPIDKVPLEMRTSIRKKYFDLNETQIRVLSLISQNENITIDEIAKSLNISNSTVEKSQRFLRESGYIERIGSNKTGYWKVLK